MPTRRTYRRKRKPQRNARRKRNYRAPRAKSRSVPTRSLSTIPDRLFTTMMYSDTITLTSSITPGYHIFQTSIFDPDLTGTGHQPLGHDQWNNFYERYRVHGIKYRIEFINTSTSMQADAVVIKKDENTFINVHDLLWERPYSQKRVLGVEGSGQGIKRITGYLAAPRALGLTKQYYRNDDLTRSAFGSNPSKMAYLHTYVSPVDSSTSVTVYVRVQLQYYCELYDRVALDQS